MNANPPVTSSTRQAMERLSAEWYASHPQRLIRKATASGEQQEGPWTYEHVESWLGKIKHQRPEFDSQWDEGRDGYDVICPGNLDGGWPDGEEHGDRVPLSNVSLLRVVNGNLVYICKRGHCDENAGHGKKTISNFRNFYDPGHLLACEIFGNQIQFDEDDIAELLAAHAAERSAPEPEPEPETEPVAESPAQSPDNLTFPAAALEGCRLLDLARSMEMPLGLAFSSVITVGSVLLDGDEMCGTRPSLYCFNIAPVGGGKDQAAQRARRVLGIPDQRRQKEGGVPPLYVSASPASSPGLMNIIGDRPLPKEKGKPVQMQPGPERLLLISKELKGATKAAQRDGSTLFEFYNEVWDDGTHCEPSRNDARSCDCRLSWVGGLPVPRDDPEAFQKFMGVEGSHGLVSRAIFGYSEEDFIYTENEDGSAWRPQRTRLDADLPVVVTSREPQAIRMWNAWRHPNDRSGRMRQNILRIATVLAAFQKETRMSVRTMQWAIAFMEWNAKIRKLFPESEAENQQAQFTEVLINKLRREGAELAPVNVKSLISRHRLARKFGANMVKFGLQNLVELGQIFYDVKRDPEGEIARDEDGKVVKSKSNVFLSKEA